MICEPAYLELWRHGVLAKRVAEAQRRLESCTLCPRRCRVNRLVTTRGAVCRTGTLARVASAHPHFGEEAPLTGQRGSGTIFFSHCNLKCVFCQNWELSQQGSGQEVTPAALADLMLDLQAQGCHNINLVSPTHVVPAILAALELAIPAGLRLPLVYNSGGYDSLETLTLLDGVIDIYMPDMKYGDPAVARRLSRARDYPQVNRFAVKEMHRQVRDLVLDDQGVATRGLLVRHLVLPGELAGSEGIFRFLAQEVSPHTYLNVMAQYHPCYKADRYPPLQREPTTREYQDAVSLAHHHGLYRLDRRKQSWSLI